MNAAGFFDGNVHLRLSERVLRHKYRQTYDGAASEVDDVVDGNHLQVQHQLFRPLDGPWQDKSGADITGLLYEKKRKDKEEGGRWGDGMAAHGLGLCLVLFSVCKHTQAQSQWKLMCSKDHEVRLEIVETKITQESSCTTSCFHFITMNRYTLYSTVSVI